MQDIRKQIKEIIERDIPLNTTCSKCEYDNAPETLIDETAQVDWDKMIDNILGVIAKHIEYS